MTHYHAVVWLDHRVAHVQHLAAGDVESIALKATGPAHTMRRADHIHHKAGSAGGHRAHENTAFFDQIIAAMAGAKEWLVVGPSTAKDEFAAYVREHRKDLAGRIMAVEPADHPTDKQVAAHARHYFRKADRMRPQAGR